MGTSAAILTGITIQCVTWSRMGNDSQGRDVLNKVLRKFAQEILKDDKADLELKSVHLLNVLMVLKSLCNSMGNANVNLAKFYAFKKESVLVVDSFFTAEIEAVLVIFKALACNFSFDSWISLTDISSAFILKQKSFVNYWGGEFAPSNMQLLLAHMQAECKQFLENICNLQKIEHVTEVLQIMSGFAQFYDRKVELNMDDMELETIFKQLTLSEGWKRQAYVDHVLDQELSQVLWDEDQLDVLIKNADCLGLHMNKIMDHFLGSTQTLLCKQKDLVGEIFETLTDIQVAEISTCFHAQYGLSKKLRRENFMQRFVSILNRTSGNTNQEPLIKKDIMILAIEDGETVIRELFDEALKNKGKVDACAMLMIILINVCKVESDNVPLFPNLVTNFLLDSSNDSTGLENVVSLATSVLQSEPCFTPYIIEGALKAVWTQFDKFQLKKAAEFANLILGILKTNKHECVIESTLQLRVCICFINILNNLEAMSVNMEQTLQLKEVTLGIIGLLIHTNTNLIKILKRENVSYFSTVDSPTVLDYIHYTTWQKDTKLSSPAISPATLSTQLVSCLPKLLQSEWKCLPAIVELVCPTAEALSIITDCLILSLSTAGSELAHNMVLALCSLITNIINSQDEVDTVLRELFMLLEVVTIELREIIWPCIHNTVGKFLSLQSTTSETLVKEVVAMTAMPDDCEERDMLIKMIQQSIS